jgi:NPCBM/NEW2 domain-containing protein
MHRSTLTLGVVLATALSSATALASADAATGQPADPSGRAGSYQVSTTVNETEPLLDTKVKVKATVTPAAPGGAVTLQVKYEGQKRWKTIDHGRLSNASKVTFKDEVGSVRERRYRVVKPAGAHRGAGQGTTPKVTVFGWRDLTSISSVRNVGFGFQDMLNINGVTYPNSLTTWTAGTQPYQVDYNLNRDCKQLTATFGLDDRSAATGTASMNLTADGTQKFAGAYGLTQAQKVGVDVTGVFRITISATTTNGGLGAVGSPQVLCSF